MQPQRQSAVSILRAELREGGRFKVGKSDRLSTNCRSEWCIVKKGINTVIIVQCDTQYFYAR
jgi:hypothetical protein